MRTRKLQPNYDFITFDGKRINANDKLTVTQLYRVCQSIQSGQLKCKVEIAVPIGELFIYAGTTATQIIKTLDEDVPVPMLNNTLTGAHFTYGFDVLYLMG